MSIFPPGSLKAIVPTSRRTKEKTPARQTPDEAKLVPAFKLFRTEFDDCGESESALATAFSRRQRATTGPHDGVVQAGLALDRLRTVRL